ncbi:glycosyltransferase [Caballeronia hypogeia]|uniref:Glycosyltransferase n=1 Tax=Caballeronia hypogeia TaxID=1777140 RepID=A0A158CMF2_9BURK|nr:bacteriohopanetetrol glucosamine biosynthesis glycosyltransferase HpnI [Caballeronia hypogeia]SAK83535.1 glycosyltransferase [Caballeronia hypogeia]
MSNFVSIGGILFLPVLAAAIYAFAAAVMPGFGKRRIFPTCAQESAITVLKPLCGAEPRLIENLASFCVQTHRHFELIFSVASPSDPAIAVVRRLQAAYPERDIRLVIDPRVHGRNLKVSNLINAAQHARHDLIVLADSDIFVAPDYLRAVTAPLADPTVGVVTCLYRAAPVGGLWPRIGALFVNEWFAPSVRVAHGGGSREYGFGATLALSRRTLEAIGGFHALKDCLADDYYLADHARRLGLRTVLSPMLVGTDVTEPGIAELWQRETRWLRTIRSINRAGFAFLFVTFSFPWMLAGMACALTSEPAPLSLPLFVTSCAGMAARVLLHARESRPLRSFWRDLSLVPLRDSLLALEWLAAVFGSTVVWRGARMPVEGHAVRQTARPMSTGR